MSEPNYFVVIDDDAINNKICRTVIERIYKDAFVETFTDPVQGFEYLASEYSKPDNNNNAILFLDINMPVMDAWDFLNLFERLESSLKNRISIFILSSSVNKADMERAMSNKNVTYYLIKPLTKESIKLITNLTVKKKNIQESTPTQKQVFIPLAQTTQTVQPQPTPPQPKPAPEPTIIPTFEITPTPAIEPKPIEIPEVEPSLPIDFSPLQHTGNIKIQQENFIPPKPEPVKSLNIDSETNSLLQGIKLKDELVNRGIPELEKDINNLIFEFEKKYRDSGLFLEPVTVNHAAFDRKKGGKMQLVFHFFEFDKTKMMR